MHTPVKMWTALSPQVLRAGFMLKMRFSIMENDVSKSHSSIFYNSNGKITNVTLNQFKATFMLFATKFERLFIMSSISFGVTIKSNFLFSKISFM